MCYLHIFVVLFFSWIPTHSTKTLGPWMAPGTPKIGLTAYAKVDSLREMLPDPEFQTQTSFQNDWISKNGTDYVIFDDLSYAVFSCLCRYPITWTIPHLQQMEKVDNIYAFDTTFQRMSYFFPNQSQPTNEYFKILIAIRFSVLSFLSVNLTCAVGKDVTPSSQHFSASSSSIYLYFTNDQLIERANETIEVYVPPKKELDTSDKDTVIFPCRPYSPNIIVTLEKQMKNKNNPNNSTIKWKMFKTPTKFVNFDPKIGFKLLKDTVGKRDLIFGLYRCTAFEEGDHPDDKQVVYVNVTSKNPQTKLETISLEPFVKLKGNASVTLLDGETVGNYPLKDFKKSFESEIYCCSGVSDVLPETHLNKCRNEFQCNLLKYDMLKRIGKDDKYGSVVSGEHLIHVHRRDCSPITVYWGAVVACDQKSIQFLEHFEHLFDKDLMPVTNRSYDAIYSISMKKYGTEAKVKSADDLEKIFLGVGYPITSEQLRLSRHHNENTGGNFFRFRKKGYFDRDYRNGLMDSEEKEPVCSLFDDMSLRKRRRRKFRNVAEYPRDQFYEGEPLVILCMGWKHLYADGAQLSILWRNGSRTIVDQPEAYYRSVRASMAFYFSGQVYGVNEKELIFRFGMEVEAHKEMMSVECWMPILETSGWDKIVKKLIILEAVPPRFVGVDGSVTEETVYFYLGEEQVKQIEWEIVSGVPEPVINVTRDGERLIDVDNPLDSGLMYIRYNFSMGILNVTKIPSKVGYNGTIAVIMTFSNVTHEIQGVYQFTAENNGGKLIRTIKVVVTGKRNILLSIGLTTITLSTLLIIGLSVKYWRQKR